LNQSRTILAAALAFVAVGFSAPAFATCTVPHTLVNGQVADASQVMDDLNAIASCADAAAVAPTGRLIGYKVITTTGAGTYVPTPGTGSILIELVGGGGGGSGVASPGDNNVGIGQSGGGAGYIRKFLSANFSGASYSVGAGGSGGAAGNNGGSDGGNTTFTNTASPQATYTAGGGKGGTIRVIAAPPFYVIAAFGGSASNGDLTIGGGSGSLGIALSTAKGAAGTSGGSAFHEGVPGSFTGIPGQSVAGNVAGAVGVGGGGAAVTTTGAAAAGGRGADGRIIIWEFGNP